MPEIVVELKGVEIRRVPIIGTDTTIGRGLDNAVVIPNPAVSRRHAVVSYDGLGFFARDLGSRNGLCLNGESLRKTVLRYGDRLEFGPHTLRLERTGGIPENRLTRPPKSAPIPAPRVNPGTSSLRPTGRTVAPRRPHTSADAPMFPTHPGYDLNNPYGDMHASHIDIQAWPKLGEVEHSIPGIALPGVPVIHDSKGRPRTPRTEPRAANSRGPFWGDFTLAFTVATVLGGVLLYAFQ